MLTTPSSGISFPLQLSGGRHSIVSGVDLIQNSIKIILAWALGTKAFSDNFGSRVEEVLESPNDDVVITLVKKFVIDAIKNWELRIEIIKVDVVRVYDEKLVIDMVYKIKDSNVQDSTRYTYYTT